MVEVAVMRFRCLPCEAAPEPPVTRPGHMAEPQTSRSHSWQPQKRPNANIFRKCRSLFGHKVFGERLKREEKAANYTI